MSIKKEIFKAYDVRGVYPKEINKKTAYAIGRAFVSFTKAKKIVVGKDIRESSDELEKSIIKGIIDQGADVVKIGLATTPMLYFASWNLNIDAGIMITASHNPAEYNGFKFCFKGAVPIGEGSGMEKIKNLAIKNIFCNKKNVKGKISEEEKIKEKYLNYTLSFFKPSFKKKKIVVDYANAMGIIDKEVFKRLSKNIELINLYDKFDGRFPNHEANPIKTETLAKLQKKVIQTKADLGMSYDGDADRIGFVDEKGAIIPMDFNTALIAKEVLKKQPNGLVLIDLRSSNSVKETIEENGGRVNYCRVGHSLIKKQMREQGAVFAGELSGHYFFEENSKAEIPTLAAIMILNLLNKSGKKMSELVKKIRRYYHSGEINSEVKNKTKVINKLKSIYKDGKLDKLDGIRIDYDDWWFNVRPSNTEPKLRLNLEAKTKEKMEKKKEELLKIITA